MALLKIVDGKFVGEEVVVPAHTPELDAAKAENEALKAKLAELEAKIKPAPKADAK